MNVINLNMLYDKYFLNKFITYIVIFKNNVHVNVCLSTLMLLHSCYLNSNKKFLFSIFLDEKWLFFHAALIGRLSDFCSMI